MLQLAAAISLGFFSSMHCIAMCGPIALALPVHHLSPLARVIRILLYNGGRCLTYSTLGLAAGAAGGVVQLAGFGKFLSIAAGSLILLYIVLSRGTIRTTMFSGKGYSAFNRIRSSISARLRVAGAASMFATGLLNGLLPCGVLYLALTAAAGTGGAVPGAVFMLGFGAGTVPAMLAMPLSHGFITIQNRKRLGRALPVAATLAGVLMILRGLSLGIPYVSPSVEAHTVSCHSPQNSILCTGHNSAQGK